MADAVATATISDAVGQALLAALDHTFVHILRGRFGGGVTTVLSQMGRVLDEKTLRSVATDASSIELALHLHDDGGLGARTGSFSTILGVVTMDRLPGGGPADIDVVTEVFDGLDPNEATDAGHLPTGVLLQSAGVGQAGLMASGGITVIRSSSALDAAGTAMQQRQRGWMPEQPRGRVNRSGGLGSNGFRRSAATCLERPISRHLLAQLGARVAAVPDLGPALGKVVLGLHFASASRA